MKIETADTFCEEKGKRIGLILLATYETTDFEIATAEIEKKSTAQRWLTPKCFFLNRAPLYPKR